MAEKDNEQIQYDKISKRHKSLVENEIKEMKDQGVDYELNYKVAFATWMEIRRARGAITQTLLSPEQIKESLIKEETEKKLNNREIDLLANLTTLCTVNNGLIFWTQDLKSKRSLVAMQTRTLERMRNYTGHIVDQDSYSKWGNAQVLYTFNDFLLNYLKNGPPKSDNLGDHFANHDKPHIFLDGISIKELKDRTEDQNRIVVFAAAASSGVLEAGIFAHYMNKVLKIPTTVDPVFFDNSFSDADVRVMNRWKPRQTPIVIPIDDRVLGTGYSPRMAKLGAREKYGKRRLEISPKMRSR